MKVRSVWRPLYNPDSCGMASPQHCRSAAGSDQIDSFESRLFPIVMPAKAGTQGQLRAMRPLDPDLRRGDMDNRNRHPP
jgi:hypothetical protein